MKKQQLILLSSACLLFTACDMNKPSASNSKSESSPQIENEADRSVTQKIRQSLMDDDSLSTNAKNIKIITKNGVVTLRGTVNNENEKSEIGKKAKAVGGVKSVDNQLEIAVAEKAPAAPAEAK